MFEKKLISHLNDKRLEAFCYASESTQSSATRMFFLLLIFSSNFGNEFSQVCYFMHFFGYTKWEYWSLTMCSEPLIQELKERFKRRSWEKKIKRIFFFMNSEWVNKVLWASLFVKLFYQNGQVINIGFLGQMRQISCQFHFHAFELKLFCLSSVLIWILVERNWLPLQNWKWLNQHNLQSY